ncbi:hypothetical protein FQN53_003985 [Emmonsiellopsis sp. PD_33]|nr:hypothetical protein FQN53_003985 [Emmonsiellopsis sp. PD_33]
MPAHRKNDRFWLRFKAVILRILMRTGMVFHGYPFPRPPCPTFTRSIRPSTSHSSPLSSYKNIALHFYTPKTYKKGSSKRWPVVVNFHGGGFTIGRPTDDARWARMAVETANAVVVSVGYRLAPEFPFPAAVDDGVDALLYLEQHAAELSLDITRISMTGFSAGGNLAISVTLRLYQRTAASATQPEVLTPYTDEESDADTAFNLNQADTNQILLNTAEQQQSGACTPSQDRTNPATNLRILSIFSWYPVLDFALPRHARRTRSKNPDKGLPPFLTELFDESYVPHRPDRHSPFASPIRAEPELLRDALPADVWLYVCEWDMLLEEGQEFAKLLEGIGKNVRSMMVEQQKHAWDKSPNPFRDQGMVDVLYLAAVEEMRGVFERAEWESGGGRDGSRL